MYNAQVALVGSRPRSRKIFVNNYAVLHHHASQSDRSGLEYLKYLTSTLIEV